MISSSSFLHLYVMAQASEYDSEMSQSPAADKPTYHEEETKITTAPRPQANNKDKKQFFLSQRVESKTRKDKQRTKLPQTMQATVTINKQQQESFCNDIRLVSLP